MKPTTLPSTMIVHIPLKFTVRGGRKTVIGSVPRQPTKTRFDDSLAKALARAYRWKTRLEDGTYASINEIAETEKINVSYVARILKLSLLAPDIVSAILDGRSTLTVEDLTKPLPTSWADQRRSITLQVPR
jgi:hypothetical protein